MAIRQLVLASLIAAASVAQADVISQPAVLSGWTVGNGSVEVIGAAGLNKAGGSNFNMVAGVKHSTDSAALADTLKNLASQNGQSQVITAQGIDGVYLLSSSRYAAIVAANLTGSNAASQTAPAATRSGGGSASTSAGVQLGGTGTGNAAAPFQPELMPDPVAANPAAAVVPAADVVIDIGGGVNAAEVPEPATAGLMLAGLAGVGFMSRRRRVK